MENPSEIATTIDRPETLAEKAIPVATLSRFSTQFAVLTVHESLQRPCWKSANWLVGKPA
jgi:hypothetical protein